MQRDSIANIIRVAVLLCLGCSLVVSAAAVLLRSQQQQNKTNYMRQNILQAAGLWEEGASVEELFEQVETRLVDLNTGEFVDSEAADVDLETYDPRQAARDPNLSKSLPSGSDPAGLKRRERYAFVYLVKHEGEVDQIVLPIRGYGLWSTLWGFLALDAQSLLDGPENLVVEGITYYEHAETPGLGGEVDNPLWKARWKGKRVFDDDWNVELQVTKRAEGDYEVDALSGATITSQGVSNMIFYWLGDDGFGPLLVNLAETSYEQLAAGDQGG